MAQLSSLATLLVLVCADDDCGTSLMSRSSARWSAVVKLAWNCDVVDCSGSFADSAWWCDDWLKSALGRGLHENSIEFICKLLLVFQCLHIITDPCIDLMKRQYIYIYILYIYI